MPHVKITSKVILGDAIAGIVVFLVALPLCLGVALASNAPAFSGILGGIIGGILVGALSGSHTSVAGPAAGLTFVVAAQIAELGSFEAFLLAIFVAGIIQVFLGVIRSGSIAQFFPSSVIKGLLAAIGLLLIFKQFPHLFGHDADYEGDMSFDQPDQENTITEIILTFFDIHPGATLIGIFSLAVLIFWDNIPTLKKSLVPAPLLLVLGGIGIKIFFDPSDFFGLEDNHLVQVPVTKTWDNFFGLFTFPDFSFLLKGKIYFSALTIALVASLETLLNLEAVDKLDPRKRVSPPNQELIAQGIGNMAAGLFGGIPVTSVIVRSSVNVNAGSKTKLSAIFHGVLLAGCVLIIPGVLNQIPLSCLAAILMATGFKLTKPKIFMQMWKEGPNQFIPFLGTVLAIFFTNLLIGVGIGLALGFAFILRSNFRRPLQKVMEKHVGSEVLRIELANQVSFLNRPVLFNALNQVPRGGHVLLDARNSDYIDADIMDLIREFQNEIAPAHGVEVSLIGFKDKYQQIQDRIQYVDYASRELQHTLTPFQVLNILKEGNLRFQTGQRLTRDFHRQMDQTAPGQHPLAVVLSCIDSRTPSELIFDLGLGDIFSVRIAGNVLQDGILGSMEYGCAVAGAKLVIVMGHSRCGAVGAALQFYHEKKTALSAIGCPHLDPLVSEIQKSIPKVESKFFGTDGDPEKKTTDLARENVSRTLQLIPEKSPILKRLQEEGKILLAGGFYDVSTGKVDFFELSDHIRPKL